MRLPNQSRSPQPGAAAPTSSRPRAHTGRLRWRFTRLRCGVPWVRWASRRRSLGRRWAGRLGWSGCLGLGVVVVAVIAAACGGGSGPVSPAARSPGDAGFGAVSVGASHSCWLRDDGSVVCWGSNHVGQADAPPGVFTAVSVGRDHTCGVRAGGAVACWGNDSYGKADAPAGAFTAVSAGHDHTCGLRARGAVTCWGSNDQGQADPPDGEFTALSSGYLYSCGLRSGGSVTCWGFDGDDQTDAPGGDVRRGQRRNAPRVRVARRWDGHVLGLQRRRAG